MSDLKEMEITEAEDGILILSTRRGRKAGSKNKTTILKEKRTQNLPSKTPSKSQTRAQSEDSYEFKATDNSSNTNNSNNSNTNSSNTNNSNNEIPTGSFEVGGHKIQFLQTEQHTVESERLTYKSNEGNYPYRIIDLTIFDKIYQEAHRRFGINHKTCFNKK
eukprot:279501_1